MLRVRGWSADKEDGAPVMRVTILIDGNAVGNATVGLSRPDVAAAYNEPRYTNSGWFLDYNVNSLSVGNHGAVAVAYDSQGATTLLGGPSAFTVSANSPPFGWVDQVSDVQ